MLRIGQTGRGKRPTLLAGCLLTERTGHVSTTWSNSRSLLCTATNKDGKPIKYTGYSKRWVTELVYCRCVRLIGWERKYASCADWMRRSLGFSTRPAGGREGVLMEMLGNFVRPGYICRQSLMSSGHCMYRQVVIIRTAQWSIYLLHSGDYMYCSVVTICTAEWSLYVPHIGQYMYHQFNTQQLHVLPHTAVFMCFVWISEQTAIISLYNINWLVFVTQTECVYCAVRSRYSRTIQANSKHTI